MTRLPPRSTLFPTRRSSDLDDRDRAARARALHRAARLRPAQQHDRDVQDHRRRALRDPRDRKSTRLNSSHTVISYAVFCLKKKKKNKNKMTMRIKMNVMRQT